MASQPQLRRLKSRPVARIWGRRDLPAAFAPGGSAGEPIGEIWFEAAADAPLLVKYLFTSERLSIQVHPDDAASQAQGFARGKDEAWHVLEAAPDAVIGIGLTHEVTPEALRAAALDGSIERLLDWRPVAAGETLYSPAGTIHAIGGGLWLIEIQQNLDLTYRLYDYGRPRELHLDEAVAVADPRPWSPPFAPVEAGPGRTILAAGGAFVLERWHAPRSANLPDGSVIVPLVSGPMLEAGAVYAASGEVSVEGPTDLLLAYPGREPLELGA